MNDRSSEYDSVDNAVLDASTGEEPLIRSNRMVSKILRAVRTGTMAVTLAAQSLAGFSCGGIAVIDGEDEYVMVDGDPVDAGVDADTGCYGVDAGTGCYGVDAGPGSMGG